MIESIKQQIKKIIESEFHVEGVVVEEPKKGNADLAIPLFTFAKLMSSSPLVVFDQFKSVLLREFSFDKIEFIAGFLNIYLKREALSKQIIDSVHENGSKFGRLNYGQGTTVVMDYSSPNIAKSFGVGHLRSTMIGSAIKNIYEKCGFHVVGVNHLGDWGTQFGKMIVAYKLWGNDSEIKANPIMELQKLYLRFHEEEKINPSLEQEARDVFRALEQGDLEYLRLWQWFKDESMKEFMEMYALLGVNFDSYDGESFYNDKMEAVVDELESKGLLKIDEGATIVDLGDQLPPALIKKSDGATLYITRDLAAILYRHKTYHTNKILYVVGNEQQLHFKQLQALTNLMGYQFEINHVNFGLVLIDGKKMSTRSGKFKRLEDVIIQAIDDAKKAIIEKNPGLENHDQVAKAVGIGAIIFNDLKNERHLDVDFNLENMLKFEGQTGPYLQYSSVRIQSILKDQTINLDEVSPTIYTQDHYFEVVKLIAQFPNIIRRAQEGNAPNLIARYTLTLASAFNSFYGKQRIITDDLKERHSNLYFVKAIQIVINEGLRILGIQSLKEM